MDKNNTGEQTNLFPDMVPNKKRPEPKDNKDKKVVSPLKRTMLMLKIQYMFLEEENDNHYNYNGQLNVKEIKSQRETKEKIADLEKRLLELLNGDQNKFKKYIEKIKSEAKEKKYNQPPNPYINEYTPQNKKNKSPEEVNKTWHKKNEQEEEEERGAPFCEKCQHYHWPQEPCSDWED